MNASKSLSFFLLFILAQAGITLWAQTPITGEQRTAIIRQLTEKTLCIKDLHCQFVQTKTSSLLVESVRTEGKMTYKAPDYLRWEYLTPKAFTMTIKGDSVFTQSDKFKNASSIKQNKLMNGIATMIMGCVSGRKLFDEKLFTVNLIDRGSQYAAEMTPRRRDMKRMFGQITFFFDKKSETIKSIEILERGGDISKIEFFPQK